jgi:hypothetical protein
LLEMTKKKKAEVPVRAGSVEAQIILEPTAGTTKGS